jgi:Xaa-Pro aminopeptidase
MKLHLMSPLALIFLSLLLIPSISAQVNPAPEVVIPKLTEPSQTEDVAVYRSRREALMKEMGEGVAAVFAAGEEDGDGYRQGSDFFYLTGVHEAGAILLLAPKERTYREFLLLPSRDPEAERWTGEREPLGAALRKKYGFAKIYRTGMLDRLLLETASRSPVFWQVTLPPASGKALELEAYGRISAKLAGVSIRSLTHSLPRMRSRHSPGEIALIQKSIRISEEGFRAAVREIRPGALEGVVEAEAERIWKSRGARRPAYSSIVGSGPNSTILHYPKSERIMLDGDLLLMDMSAEYAHYASDITRTVPVNGKFTPLQRKVYDVVLQAQRAAFDLVKPGVYFEDLDAAARKVIEAAGYGDFFIHGLGHFVGLDVHDAGEYQEPLAAGMVITIEPGIYLPQEKFGIRIEDDVLITESGAKWMSDGLPRDPREIEQWMKSVSK